MSLTFDHCYHLMQSKRANSSRNRSSIQTLPCDGNQWPAHGLTRCAKILQLKVLSKLQVVMMTMTFLLCHLLDMIFFVDMYVLSEFASLWAHHEQREQQMRMELRLKDVQQISYFVDADERWRSESKAPKQKQMNTAAPVESVRKYLPRGLASELVSMLSSASSCPS